MARRKKAHAEEENHERWLVSYADFITLLFAFFVVMYAVSSVNEGKYRVLSESLVTAFRSSARALEPIQVGRLARETGTQGIIVERTPAVIDMSGLPPPRPQPATPPRPAAPATPPAKADGQGDKVPQAGPPPAQAAPESAAKAQREGPPEAMQEVAAQIEQAMAPLIEQELINVRRKQHQVEVEIKTSILFPSGSASLSRDALPVLERLAKILRPLPNPIHVEGFTDNVPIRNRQFPSNWELSAARAAGVVHLFMSAGVDPRRMAAVGYGEHRPVADNASAVGRRKNRRVVLVIPAVRGDAAVADRLSGLGPDADVDSAPVATGAEPLRSGGVTRRLTPLTRAGENAPLAPPVRLPILGTPPGPRQ